MRKQRHLRVRKEIGSLNCRMQFVYCDIVGLQFEKDIKVELSNFPFYLQNHFYLLFLSHLRFSQSHLSPALSHLLCGNCEMIPCRRSSRVLTCCSCYVLSALGLGFLIASWGMRHQGPARRTPHPQPESLSELKYMGELSTSVGWEQGDTFFLPPSGCMSRTSSAGQRDNTSSYLLSPPSLSHILSLHSCFPSKLTQLGH